MCEEEYENDEDTNIDLSPEFDEMLQLASHLPRVTKTKMKEHMKSLVDALEDCNWSLVRTSYCKLKDYHRMVDSKQSPENKGKYLGVLHWLDELLDLTSLPDEKESKPE